MVGSRDPAAGSVGRDLHWGSRLAVMMRDAEAVTGDVAIIVIYLLYLL